MGLRSKLKGRLKTALGRSDQPKPQSDSESSIPEKHQTAISEDRGGGNLRGDEDVPWYLKFDDNDGWESTDANPDVDDE